MKRKVQIERTRGEVQNTLNKAISNVNEAIAIREEKAAQKRSQQLRDFRASQNVIMLEEMRKGQIKRRRAEVEKLVQSSQAEVEKLANEAIATYRQQVAKKASENITSAVIKRAGARNTIQSLNFPNKEKFMVNVNTISLGEINKLVKNAQNAAAEKTKIVTTAFAARKAALGLAERREQSAQRLKNATAAAAQRKITPQNGRQFIPPGIVNARISALEKSAIKEKQDNTRRVKESRIKAEASVNKLLKAKGIRNPRAFGLLKEVTMNDSKNKAFNFFKTRKSRVGLKYTNYELNNELKWKNIVESNFKNYEDLSEAQKNMIRRIYVAKMVYPNGGNLNLINAKNRPKVTFTAEKLKTNIQGAVKEYNANREKRQAESLQKIENQRLGIR